MITWLRHRLSKARELRMIWEVEGGGKRSYLVGTAHFFPYHFRGRSADTSAGWTRCSSRDPWTKSRHAQGPTIAFVGASHCPGIERMLHEAGYRVGTPTPVSS